MLESKTYSPSLTKDQRDFFYFPRHELKVMRVENQSDYLATLYFRRKIYIAEGCLKKECSINDFINLYDNKCRIFNLRWKNEIVATVSIHIPKTQDFIECLEDVDQSKVFDILMKKMEIIEVSRICIDQRFKGSNINSKIFEIVHRELVMANRSIVITSCSDSQLDGSFHKTFNQIGVEYRRKFGESEYLKVLISNHKILGTYGLNLGPIEWNWLLGNIHNQLLAFYNLNLAQRIIFKFYKCFSPISVVLNNISQISKWVLWQIKIKDSAEKLQ